jgi:hypothetical protein
VAIANGYATLAQIKSALRIPSADATDDSLLEMAVESASRLIDAYCGRNFIASGTAATTRYYNTDDPYVVQIDDARSISQVQTSTSLDGVYDTIWTVGTAGGQGDAQPEPINDYLGGITWPYTRIRAIGDYTFPTGPENSVKVTAVYGFPTIPVTVTQAAILQSSRIFTRLQSPLGVAGFGDMGIMRVSRGLDPDVAQLIEGYRKFKGVA